MWEWSHSNEAYANAQHNVEHKPKEWLDVTYAEWKANDGEDDDYFNEDKYWPALKEATELTDDVLADYIWERMSEQAHCSNGGHLAYCCPYGCHTVPFDKENDD